MRWGRFRVRGTCVGGILAGVMMGWGSAAEAQEEKKPATPSEETQQEAKPAQPVPVTPGDPEHQLTPAIQGYCPVSYFTKGAATKGNAKYYSVIRGATYFFADEEAKKTFDAEPEKYLPQFGALCTTALGGSYGNRLPSDPTVFDVFEGKLYLFSSERAKRAYVSRPPSFIQRATELFERPDLDGHDPVAYQQRAKAMKGKQAIKCDYQNRIYYFLNEVMRDDFRGDPERYLPKYDGYCAEGMARGKLYPADPAVFAVFENRTYLFFDDLAKVKFMMSATENVRKAETEWARIQAEKKSAKTLETTGG